MTAQEKLTMTEAVRKYNLTKRGADDPGAFAAGGWRMRRSVTSYLSR